MASASSSTLILHVTQGAILDLGEADGLPLSPSLPPLDFVVVVVAFRELLRRLELTLLLGELTLSLLLMLSNLPIVYTNKFLG